MDETMGNVILGQKKAKKPIYDDDNFINVYVNLSQASHILHLKKVILHLYLKPS